MCACIIRDGASGIFITLDEESFMERLTLAERRRKAKHAGRFGMCEFARMFGLRPSLWDQYTEIDKDYPISFDYSVCELEPLGKNVNYYILTYQTKVIES